MLLWRQACRAASPCHPSVCVLSAPEPRPVSEWEHGACHGGCLVEGPGLPCTERVVLSMEGTRQVCTVVVVSQVLGGRGACVCVCMSVSWCVCAQAPTAPSCCGPAQGEEPVSFRHTVPHPPLPDFFLTSSCVVFLAYLRPVTLATSFLLISNHFLALSVLLRLFLANHENTSAVGPGRPLFPVGLCVCLPQFPSPGTSSACDGSQERRVPRKTQCVEIQPVKPLKIPKPFRNVLTSPSTSFLFLP